MSFFFLFPMIPFIFWHLYFLAAFLFHMVDFLISVLKCFPFLIHLVHCFHFEIIGYFYKHNSESSVHPFSYVRIVEFGNWGFMICGRSKLPSLFKFLLCLMSYTYDPLNITSVCIIIGIILVSSLFVYVGLISTATQEKQTNCCDSNNLKQIAKKYT